MKSFKGQIEPVTVVALVALMIGLIGSAYLWGSPLIEKREDVTKMNDAIAFMNLLNDKIKAVAMGGGTETLPIRETGRFKLIPYDVADSGNNSIYFFMEAKGSAITSDEWILINTQSGGPVGILGEEEIGVVKAFSESHADRYNFTLELKYRNLYSATKGYRIEITNPSGIKAASYGKITISPDGQEIVNENGIEVMVKRVRVSFD